MRTIQNRHNHKPNINIPDTAIPHTTIQQFFRRTKYQNSPSSQRRHSQMADPKANLEETEPSRPDLSTVGNNSNPVVATSTVKLQPARAIPFTGRRPGASQSKQTSSTEMKKRPSQWQISSKPKPFPPRGPYRWKHLPSNGMNIRCQV